MPRHGVQYVNNEEPAFIKQFKQKIGHKDGPDVNTKRQIPNFDEDDDDDDVPEKEDEQPTVVVLKSGDLTAEEAKSEQKQIDEGPARLDEKITFKKPTKRVQDSTNSTTETSGDAKKIKETKKKKESKSKKTKNSSLLSFGEDDEEG